VKTQQERFSEELAGKNALVRVARNSPAKKLCTKNIGAFVLLNDNEGLEWGVGPACRLQSRTLGAGRLGLQGLSVLAPLISDG
jgi:hypothetical protein